MATPTLTPLNIAVSPRGYDDLFAALLAAVPTSKFYDLSRPIVPWRQKPVLFQLTTDNPGVPVQIYAVNTGDYYPTVDAGNLINVVQYAPQANVTTFGLTLGRGLNRLTLTEEIPGGRTIVFEVICTTLATLFEAMGRTISYSTLAVEAQSQALRSPYSTRMLDQVVDFSGIFSELQSLKIMSSKLLIRSNIWFPSTVLGTRNLIEAFTINTPVFVPLRQKPSLLHIERSRVNRVQENAAGQEAHIWFPNSSVTRWSAFLAMADSFSNNYQIQNVSDDLVQILYKSETQFHQFDFDAANTSFLANFSQVNCFTNFDVSGTFGVTSNYIICAWSYYFDDFVPAASPIGAGRGPFDTGVPLDSGLTFDVDPIDPYTDGWIGWSLSGRFDHGLALDTAVMPERGYSPQCVYQGPYTQMFNTTNTTIEVPAEVGFDPTNTNITYSYTPGPIVALAMTFPYPAEPLMAGTPVQVVVLYADSNNMTNPSGAGTVSLQETPAGALTSEVVTGGYSQFMLTPTKAGPSVYWALSDGTYTGQSLPQVVLPGPFAGLSVSAIPNQAVGVPFQVVVQAIDAYGNPVTDVGANTKVVIQPLPGFSPTSAAPTFVNLVDGYAFFSIAISTAGTGQLEFLLDAITESSNPFTVS